MSEKALMSLEAAERMYAFSERAGPAGVLPKGFASPADVAVVAAYGVSLGKDAFWALRNMHLIEGRPTLSATAMASLALEHPACEYLHLEESTAERATYVTKRKGAPSPTRISFTIDEAKAAGLLGPKKENWHRYPAAMLRARALTAVVRAVYPDAISGCYTREELTDGRVLDDQDVIDVEVVASAQPTETPPAKSSANAQAKTTRPARPADAAPSKHTLRAPSMTEAEANDALANLGAPAMDGGKFPHLDWLIVTRAVLGAPDAGEFGNDYHRGGSVARLLASKVEQAVLALAADVGADAAVAWLRRQAEAAGVLIMEGEGWEWTMNMAKAVAEAQAGQAR